MARLTEAEMLGALDAGRVVFLLEPPHRRKHIPMGLARIAGYLRLAGKAPRYGRWLNRGDADVDLVCVGSLWTQDLTILIQSIDRARRVAPRARIVVGGVLASLMPDLVAGATGADVFCGTSPVLDAVRPDYSLAWRPDPKFETAAFVYTTRGCPNSCPYCVVGRIERPRYVVEGWREQMVVRGKDTVLVSDNNLLAWPDAHWTAVLDAVEASGLKACFDNGFDCHRVDDDVAARLARLRYGLSGLRMSFDRVGDDGVFQSAARRLIKAGCHVEDMMAFVLYNFHDTPAESHYKLMEVLRLGIRPYPQQYVPLDKIERAGKHVGRYWTDRALGAFRFYWLMRGIHNKETLPAWLRRAGARQCRLGPRDLDILMPLTDWVR
jgi:hypothetical protein